MARKAKQAITASSFYDDVVRVLGELSDFQAKVNVPSKDIVAKVLADRGLTKESFGRSTTRTDKKYKAILFVEWAFRNQRAKYRGKNTKAPIYVAQGSKRGMWMLTEAGAKKAKSLHESATPKGGNGGGGPSLATVTPDSVVETEEPVVEVEAEEVEAEEAEAEEAEAEDTKSLYAEDDPRNHTKRYLEENWSRVYPRLCRSLAAKLPRSREYSLVEDHVMSFVARCIDKDSLRKYLVSGTLTMTKLTWFAYRAATSEMRPWGREPVTRALRGARTETELKAWRAGVGAGRGKETVALQSPELRTMYRTAGNYSGRREGLGGDTRPHWHHRLGDLNNLEERVAEADLAEKFLAKIEAVLRNAGRNPEHGERLCHLVHGLINQNGPTDLAREMGLNRSTVSNRVQALKHTLFRARDRGEFQEFLEA